MEPLSAPEIAKIDESASRAERALRFVPIFGWIMSAAMWQSRVSPIVKSIRRQLSARGFVPDSIWGLDAHRRGVATWLCQAIADEIGWRSANYIPEDPLSVLLWAHDDGLDLESLVLQIEDKIGTKVTDNEIYNWFDHNLDFLVNELAIKVPKPAESHETWPPPIEPRHR